MGSVPGLREDVVINVVLAKYLRSISVDIGRCQSGPPASLPLMSSVSLGINTNVMHSVSMLLA